jgi:ubiquinone/menaquinone biosynthesis C-methylase UbiE
MTTSRPELVTIDIGCGPSKHPLARYGVDRLQLPDVDFVCDLEVDPLPFTDSSVDAIFTRHTLEHIRDLDRVLREIVRVAKPRARVTVVVPHFSNSLGFSDPTHVRFFGYFTFDYYSRQKDTRWRVPSYTDDVWFHIIEKRYCFRNFARLGPVLEWMFNGGGFFSYFYESKLSWFIPCFELQFELSVDK